MNSNFENPPPHEPLDIVVEVTGFEEYGFTSMTGGQGIGYRIGLALTNNGKELEILNVWPANEFGFPMAEALFGIPGADCAPTNSMTRTSVPSWERVVVDLCSVRNSNTEIHHIKIVSVNNGGVLVATITDVVNEDLCDIHTRSSYSHCTVAEFTGPAPFLDYKGTALMGVVGVGVVVVIVFLVRRRRQ